MRKSLIVLVVALLSLQLGAAPLLSPSQVQQHRAAHKIVLENSKARGGCSATAVAPNMLLTARHCDIADAQLFIDDSFVAQPIARKIYDDRDGMILVLTNVQFSTWVAIPHPADYVPAAPGETAYWWGNPHGVMDIFRVGYVVGSVLVPGKTAAPGVPLVLIEAPAVPGDSGSGIYADGRLVGVLTYGVFGGTFAGFYALHFTEKQLQEAGL